MIQSRNVCIISNNQKILKYLCSSFNEKSRTSSPFTTKNKGFILNNTKPEGFSAVRHEGPKTHKKLIVGEAIHKTL